MQPPLARGFARLTQSWVGALFCVALSIGATNLRAQEMQAQDTPMTAWLDLRAAAPGAATQTAPTWVESFEFVPADATLASAEGKAPATVFRVRVHRPPAAVNDLQVRVFFDDRAEGEKPTVSAWNELGNELARSRKLGQGVGLPSSESITVPMTGVDYLEVSAPGDGTQIRALFLSWLEKTEVLQAVDFPTQSHVLESFHMTPTEHLAKEDGFLYGVVTARLQSGKPVVIKPEEGSATTFEFPLERQPLLAVVNYEVLGSTIGAPLAVVVNGKALGTAELHFPDLSDPGYRGQAGENGDAMQFRYTGWVHAQKVIPGELLAAGLNTLTVALSNNETVAVRSVQIQLKYNWEKLDYTASPAPSSP